MRLQFSSSQISLVQVGDVGCAVHLCSLLHQRYADFSHHLLEQLQKSYSGGIGKEEDKVGVGSCVGGGMVGGGIRRKNELFILTLYSTVCSHCKVQNWSPSPRRGEVDSCLGCLLDWFIVLIMSLIQSGFFSSPLFHSLPSLSSLSLPFPPSPSPFLPLFFSLSLLSLS